MTFEDFVTLYTADMYSRLKENTWEMRDYIVRIKFLPYFGKRKMNKIHFKEILAWQNEMINHKDKEGEAVFPGLPQDAA